jgi:hypothetical protein
MEALCNEISPSVLEWHTTARASWRCALADRSVGPPAPHFSHLRLLLAWFQQGAKCSAMGPRHEKLVPSVDAKSIGWNEVAVASLPKLERLTKLAHAEVAVAQGSAIRLGRGGRGATSSRHGRDREQQGGV